MPESPVIIRSLLPADHAAEAVVVAGAFAAGPYGHLSLTEARRSFQNDSGGRAAAGEVFVAIVGDRLVGSATVLRGGGRYTRVSREGEAEIRLLAVDPAHQGRGIAAALMAAALETAASWGADALVLDTGHLNTRSQALYERLGFVRRPEREAAISDADVTALVYAYPLQQGLDVRVRLMMPAETETVAELIDAAYSHDYELHASYRANIVAVADRARDNQVRVAEDRASGRLIGTVTTPHAGRAISELAQDGELDFRLLAVDPAARRSGIGELLTRHVLMLARIRRAERVVMNSGPEMVGAHRLYERMGFTRMPDREPIIVRDDGSTLQLLAFGYRLG